MISRLLAFEKIVIRGNTFICNGSHAMNSVISPILKLKVSYAKEDVESGKSLNVTQDKCIDLPKHKNLQIMTL